MALERPLILVCTCDYLGGGKLKNKLSTLLSTLFMLLGLSLSSISLAAPKCPPQYQEICKQLIQTLDQYNDGKHFYKWDGTRLIVDYNFASYDTINNSATDIRNGQIDLDSWTLAFKRDAFPELLDNVIRASNGGQRVYLHLTTLANSQYNNVGMSNLVAPPNPVLAPPNAPPTPVNVPNQAPPKVPPKIPQAVPQPMVAPVLAPPNAPPTPLNVPNQAPPKVPPKIPQAVPQPMVAPVLAPPNAPPTPVNVPNQAPLKVPPKIPQAVPQPMHQPKQLSITYGVTNSQGVPVNKSTVNGHFATVIAGNHLDQESRAYLVDSNQDVWSCMVAGLSQRPTTPGNERSGNIGHSETLDFRSTHIAHIPANHPMHTGCLISVQQ